MGVPSSLEDLISVSIQIDRRLRERRQEKSTGPSQPVWMMPKVPVRAQPTSAKLPSSKPATETSTRLGLIRPSLSLEEPWLAIMYVIAQLKDVEVTPLLQLPSQSCQQLPLIWRFPSPSSFQAEACLQQQLWIPGPAVVSLTWHSQVNNIFLFYPRCRDLLYFWPMAPVLSLDW